MAQQAKPSNKNYRDGASRSIRDPYKRTNIERLVEAVTRTPGITEITLEFHFTPGDFFYLYNTELQAKGYPNAWSHRIPEVTRTAVNQGLIRAVPTSHPDYTAYYPVSTVNLEEVAA